MGLILREAVTFNDDVDFVLGATENFVLDADPTNEIAYIGVTFGVGISYTSANE